MGIRCWCPNGHKLNIKAFQAGKRGICPYCGARFTIPLESTRKPGMGDRIPEPMEHSVHEGPVSSPPSSPGSSAPASTSGEAGPFLAAPTPLGISAGGPAGGEKGAGVPSAEEALALQPPPSSWSPGPFGGGGAPAPEASIPPPPSAPADPLAEAPHAVWYVRPPTGGQFGPAPADVMRNWIAEGRVSPDSLVWREGWRDWQEAGQVFPHLLGPAPFPFPSSWASEAPKIPVRKRGPQPQNLWLLGVLVLAVAVLLGVFLYVAFGPLP